jgi:hypothetical protein
LLPLPASLWDDPRSYSTLQPSAPADLSTLLSWEVVGRAEAGDDDSRRVTIIIEEGGKG